MKRFVTLILVIAMLGQPVVAQGEVHRPSALAQEEVTLTVSVTTPSGDPIRGVELTASWNGGSTTATTASNGKAFLDVAKGRDVAIETNHEEYVRNRPYMVVNSEEETVEVDMYPIASAVIHVSDSDETVENARLIVRKQGKVAVAGRTNEDGVFRTGSIEEGNYGVTVFKQGYYKERIDVAAEGSVEENVTIEHGSVTVSFNVTDDHFADPKAVSSADVEIADVGAIKTRDNGRAAINLPVNSEFEVTVDKEGYDEVTTEVTIDEQPDEVDLTLERTPGIFIETVNQKVVAGQRSRVEVTNSYGEPVEGATVALNGDEVGETSESGVFMVPIETKGNHTIRATKGSLESQSVTVQAFSTEREKQRELGEDEGESDGFASFAVKVIENVVDKLAGLFG